MSSATATPGPRYLRGFRLAGGRARWPSFLLRRTPHHAAHRRAQPAVLEARWLQLMLPSITITAKTEQTCDCVVNGFPRPPPECQSRPTEPETLTGRVHIAGHLCISNDRVMRRGRPATFLQVCNAAHERNYVTEPDDLVARRAGNDRRRTSPELRGDSAESPGGRRPSSLEVGRVKWVADAVFRRRDRFAPVVLLAWAACRSSAR